VEDDDPVAAHTLPREQQPARQLGVAGVGADGENRPRGCSRARRLG
jgi:hypothetical protein